MASEDPLAGPLRCRCNTECLICHLAMHAA
jgi:hypothetical protein